MNKIKIKNLKKGIDGMKLYLSTFKSWPKKDLKKNWRFIQETSKSYFNAFSKCGLNFNQVYEIMDDCFTAMGNISIENKHLKINSFIQGVMDKAVSNEQ